MRDASAQRRTNQRTGVPVALAMAERMASAPPSKAPATTLGPCAGTVSRYTVSKRHRSSAVTRTRSYTGSTSTTAAVSYSTLANAGLASAKSAVPIKPLHCHCAAIALAPEFD